MDNLTVIEKVLELSKHMLFPCRIPFVEDVGHCQLQRRSDRRRIPDGVMLTPNYLPLY